LWHRHEKANRFERDRPREAQGDPTRQADLLKEEYCKPHLLELNRLDFRALGIDANDAFAAENHTVSLVTRLEKSITQTDIFLSELLISH
jgi:hypothetical protein